MLFRVVSPAFTRKAVSVGRASRLGSAALTSTRGPASGLCGRLFSSNNTEIPAPAPASAAEGAAGSETIETVRSQMAEKEKQLKELKVLGDDGRRVNDDRVGFVPFGVG